MEAIDFFSLWCMTLLVVMFIGATVYFIFRKRAR